MAETVAIAELLAAHKVATVPRLALNVDEAAAAIGASRDWFEEHVLADVRIVRRGRKRLVPVRELERWIEENAEGLRCW